jgi:hypothetical protein
VVGIGADFELEAVGGVAADDFEGDIGRAGNPTADTSSALTEGWAQLTSSQSIGGTAIFC